MTLNLKLDDSGNAVIRNGHPVYLNGQGAELEFNPAEMLSRTTAAETALESEKIGRLFDRSAFVADKLSIPAEMAHAYFGGAFKLENGRPVAYRDGVKVYSRINAGEPAGLDEALEILLRDYPHRARITKGTDRSATAAPTVASTTAQGQGGMLRAAFERMAPAARMSFIKGGGRLTD